MAEQSVPLSQRHATASAYQLAQDGTSNQINIMVLLLRPCASADIIMLGPRSKLQGAVATVPTASQCQTSIGSEEYGPASTVGPA